MNRDKKQKACVKAKITSPINDGLRVREGNSNWKAAAADASAKIKEYQQKIRGLRLAIGVFERYAAEGQLWPGDKKGVRN